MSVLAFDPASRTGWAYYGVGPSGPLDSSVGWACGSFDLGDRNELDKVITLAYGPGLYCVCEDPHFNRGNGKKIHFAMRDIEHAWGAVSNEPVEYIALATWRAWHGIKKDALRYSLKQQAIDKARELGATIPVFGGSMKIDDNAAEAVCIAAYAMARRAETEAT